MELPLELNSHDIQGNYNIIRVTALLTDDVLFIVMTIPLKDTSLQMNVYKVHNLPLIHPKLNISVTYELEGKWDTPTPKCQGNRSLLVVLFLLKLRVVPHGTKGTSPKFVTRSVYTSP